MSEFKPIGGFWVAVNVDVVTTDQAFLHVAVSVTDFDQFAVEELDVALQAGDQLLAQSGRPADNSALIYLRTKAITAIAQFSFDNPQGRALTRVSVTLRGETESWDLTTVEPGPPLVA